MFRSFEELEVWKRACRLAVRVYELLRDCRDFGLRDQMQRASVSIASNIAEGSERSPKDFARFLTIAAKVNAIGGVGMEELVDECKQLSKMLRALSKSINNEIKT